ncbi:zinc-dependent alcohol dehydrogenase family protein [Mucilaginibacter sp.]|uniref:zinc-dependent alcohol dehydrogenase family protein n=1 Tax=Mucilaginibacter sp. TaxID=1882438 RepID=UPI00261EFB33|nr:zinc-dependent alcohol dehydrogenase family protein [Mucilaginibacter sp.]
MILEKAGQPLTLKEIPLPVPAAGQVLVQVLACGVCRTDLHIIDGELNHPKLPLVPGHEIVGRVAEIGQQVGELKIGDIVGIPWLAYTCGQCHYCQSGKENLCENAEFTGYTVNGGYAEYMVAYAAYCFRLPPDYTGPGAAPLLCAGLIGFRSYRMADADAKNIGLYGFGAAAHILIQVAVAQGKKLFAFTRPGDTKGQAFAIKLGAAWAGGSDESPPEKLDTAIIFAPAGELIPLALKATDKGGRVICGGIHMSAIPSFSYDLLWEERMIRSVANLTRQDGHDFFALLQHIPVHTQTRFFKLAEANEALDQLRNSKIKGAAVLVMDKKN